MKVLLIDDHPLILAALQSVIQELGDGVTVSTASNSQTARTALSAHEGFDLILLDLNLGADDGFELLQEFRENYPAVPVVVISASDRTSDVIRSIDMGAMGFVPKRASNETLIEALQQVMKGGVYVPPMSMGAPQAAAEVNAAPSIQATATHHGYQQTLPLEQLGLTPRQGEVLSLLLKGLPNKLVARELDLSVETVKDHVAAVLRALGVSSRTQAVIAVSQMLQAKNSMAWRPL